jgi:hypothetical protein
MTYSLVPVGITVAPSPVVSVCSSVRSAELMIGAVLCYQVTPIGPILAVIPVMIIAVISIVIPDVAVVVASFVLISGLGHACRCREKSSSQKE